MKTFKNTSITFLGLVLLSTSLLLIFKHNGRQNSGNKQLDCKIITCSDTRESITFILGEDKEKDNPYYAEAKNYYLYNASGRTSYLIEGIESLTGVLEYLKDNPPANFMPWGTINLVAHGNQWNGLSVQVTPESGRATDERIKTYLEENSSEGLATNILDEQTLIFVHGCGLGNNHQLIRNIAEFFRTKDATPVVRASRLFEYYSSTSVKSKITTTQRYYARAWLISYKMGYQPDKNLIAADFQNKYPKSKINWNYALANTQAKWAGDLYHYTFEVPVKWIIKNPSPDSLPDFTSQSSQRRWVMDQKEITDKLSRLELPAEKFNWWLRKVYVTNPDGTKSPAMWVKGYCTIVCIVQPLIDSNSEITALPEPFLPEENDSNYFYSCSIKPEGYNVNKIETVIPGFVMNNIFGRVSEPKDELYKLINSNENK